MEHVVWTQWDDLLVPASITKLSPKNTPIETSDLSTITFYVPQYMGGRPALELTRKMTNLKILQMPNAGYDDALEFVRPGMSLCNGRGIHDASTAELAVGMTIASLRDFPDFITSQSKGVWAHHGGRSINDRKIGIVGYGAIGQRIARNLSGFDVEIVGFSNSGANGSIKMVDFDKHLPTLDVVILIMPLTDQSRGFFNKERLARMKDGALLVNVARGPIVDTDALVAELNSGRITAALDVTDPEPLPAGHPLWNAKGLFITPHIGGNSSAFEPRARKLIESQLQLLAAGKPLDNVIIDGSK